MEPDKWRPCTGCTKAVEELAKAMDASCARRVRERWSSRMCGNDDCRGSGRKIKVGQGFTLRHACGTCGDLVKCPKAMKPKHRGTASYA